MRITIIGTAHPYRGGLAAFNERLALQFVSEGHQVNIVTFTLQYPNFLFPGKTQYTSDPAPKGLTIDRGVNSCNPLNWISCGKAIARRNPDIVLFAYWMSFMAPCFGTIARTIKLHSKACCLALVHNMIPHEPNLLDKLFPSYFVGAMDGFTALSQSVVDDIKHFDTKNKPKNFAPHPIYDHYGTILDTAQAKQLLGLDPQTHYALFFGFIRPYKGLDLLIEAFTDVRLKELNVKLLIAGEFYGDPKPYLDRIEQLGIGDRIVLKNDYIPDNEVNRYFGASDIVAQPYKSATQSGVTQVAFHFEKPMLVTNVGGLAEIVPNGKIGYVVAPDPKQIANALADYFSANRQNSFTEGVRNEKKKYAWSNMTQAISHIAAHIKK